MTRPKTWSTDRIQHPKYPGFTVRIGEFQPGGTLQVFRWVDGRQTTRSLKKTRADIVADLRARGLKATPKEQEDEARRIGCMCIEAIAAQPDSASTPLPSSGPLTLKALANKYEDEGFAGRTAGYKRDSLASIRRVAAFLGDLAVVDVTPNAVQRYLEHRKAKGHAPAGRSDLVALSIAANWAIGEKLLTVNPLADKKALKMLRKFKTTPARAVVDKPRYAALKEKADQLPEVFGVLVELAWHTGRRISAILGLRWQDVSFTKTDDAPHGSITWYAGAAEDNKKHEHVRPMNKAVSAALKDWQKATGGIGAKWVFASETDPATALERHTTKKWLRRAEKLAKLQHMKHGGWHAFRRGWATERKNFPLKDVAEAGGWKETQSVLECYLHADKATTNKVLLKVV